MRIEIRILANNNETHLTYGDHGEEHEKIRYF